MKSNPTRLRTFQRRALLVPMLLACACSSDGKNDSTSNGTDATLQESATSSTQQQKQNGLSVSGTVDRSVEAGYGGDGVGTLYLALVAKCPTTADDSKEPPIASAAIENANVSASGVQFVLPNVPPGTYQLNAFLDDVVAAGADPASPFPGKGDMVSFSGFAAQCVSVDVQDTNVEGVIFTLNMVMPIDLPGI